MYATLFLGVGVRKRSGVSMDGNDRVDRGAMGEIQKFTASTFCSQEMTYERVYCA